MLEHLEGYRELLPLASLRPMRRWASNWLRLFFALSAFRTFEHGSLYRDRPLLTSTGLLDFPGKGPVPSRMWIFPAASFSVFRVFRV